MEKIYMENDSEKTKNKKVTKGRGLLLTSVLMVIVAAAIFITSNFGQTSFAAEVTPERTNYRLINNNIGIQGVNGLSRNFLVTPYYFVEEGSSATEGTPVMCIQYQKDGVNDKLYTPGDELTDAGLVELLFNANAAAAKVAGESKDVQMAATWIYQTAIWVYQHRNTSSKLIHDSDVQGDESWRYICKNSDCKCEEENCNPLVTVSALRYGRKGETDTTQISTVAFGNMPEYLKLGGASFSDSVYKLVTTAEKATANDSSEITMDLVGKDAKEGKSDDYYTYGPIVAVVKTTGANWPNQFKAYINSAIEGAVLTDKDGKEINKDTSLAPGTELYIRVPKKSLTEEKRAVTIHADSSINSTKVVSFTSDGSQTMAFFEQTTKSRFDDFKAEFNIIADVPDTGMTTAQTIYFIGLVVLLCGVGIVYANVKPKEAE